MAGASLVHFMHWSESIGPPRNIRCHGQASELPVTMARAALGGARMTGVSGRQRDCPS